MPEWLRSLIGWTFFITVVLGILAGMVWLASQPTYVGPGWTVYQYSGVGVQYYNVSNPSVLRKSGNCVSGPTTQGGSFQLCGNYSIKRGDGSDF